MPFGSDYFDSVTIAFGIRNVVDRSLGLAELWRVLKPGGRLIILEFSTPRSAIFRWIYHFYFKTILPAIGGLFSKFDAYKYLPDSVMEFPSSKEFCNTMTDIGFKSVRCQPLTFGIASIYSGIKE
jgi:demethylmenaquinone methyltransferase/2-methoxy-6-polyprenyl-1,4-benzoquinol methylase